jgi:CHAT domain-containing protein
VVLVPAGVLGAIPWAAARLPGPGPVRYACAELMISTAASARQLLDVAGRAPTPDGAVVLVGAPTASLPGATEEVAALRDGPYPEAVVLDGAAATPDAVLDRLPGAALVHLACHAISAESADESRLELTAPLPVRRVLDRATRRATSPGPSVVLSSCSSDLTGRDHDEALTLATAFLAAGAITVIGTRWPVLDRYAGIVTFALHHFRAAGLPAADALRRTQLWLLDPFRVPLPGMPEPMRRRCRSRMLADVSVWAAFGHQGR